MKNFNTLPTPVKIFIVAFIALLLAVVAKLLGVDVPVIPDWDTDPTPSPSSTFSPSPTPLPTLSPTVTPTPVQS